MTAFGFPGNEVEQVGWPRRRIAPLIATHGAVAAAHPLVATSGLAMLRSGGNAVDAAVAASLVAAVVMPEMCGLGGDLFAIVHDTGSGKTQSVNSSGISPGAATIEQMREAGDSVHMPYRGALAVGVPGMVAGYGSLLERFGTRSFGNVAAAAIDYSENGHPVGAGLAQALVTETALLSSFPSSAAVLLPGGVPPAQGELLVQRDLARSLKTISLEGTASFYQGAMAQSIVRFLQRNGSLFSLEDFAAHEVVVGEPLWSTYRGYRVATPPPVSQGLILNETLNIVEAASATALPGGSPESIHLQVEAKKRAYADRLAFAQDPATAPDVSNRLLSPDWARMRALTIDPHRATDIVPPGSYDSGDTTYIATVDGNGMMVSLIQSVSSAFGCGMIAGNTGIILNNRAGRGFSLEQGHPNQFAGGKRTMSTLLCYLVAGADGTPLLVGGTPGGDGQPQWNLQTLSWLIDEGADVQTAIEAPRWTSWPGTDPGSLPNPYELRMEERFDLETIETLRAIGHHVVVQPAWGGGGSAQAIARDPDSGLLCAGSDPRVEGMAVAW